MIQRSSVSLIGLIPLIGLSAVLATPAAAAPLAVSVSGKVLDPHGRPAAGATVYVSASDATNWPGGTEAVVRQATAGADGAFRLEMPTPSEHWTVTVAALKAGYGPGLRAVWRGTPATGLALVLTEANSIAGRVVDAAGAPIAGARVKPGWIIDSEGDGGSQIPEAALAPATTDAQGKFRLAPLPAHCRLDLSVEHPGYALPLGASDRVRTGEAEVTISLVPAGAIAGRLVCDDGRPAAKVGVDCLTTGTVVPAAMTDAEGRFRFSRLLPGAYLLLPQPSEALAEFEAGMERVVVAAGGEARCADLTLKRLAGSPAVLSGKVTDAATGRPLAGVEVGTQRLIAGPGMVDIPINGPSTWTGADGTYRMRLPPGMWSAWTGFLAGYTNGPVWNGPSELPAAPGKALTRDFALASDQDTILHGQVLDADGRPAAGAKLRAWPGGVLITDIDGRFRFPLYVGHFARSTPDMPTARLAVLGVDRTQGAVLDVRPEDAKRERIVRLRRLPRASGLVTDEHGTPIAHVEVRADLFLSRQPGGPGEFATALAAATTDARGRFSLPLVPGATCRVSVQPAGFVPERRLVTLRPGALPAPLRLRLQRGGGVIAGVVVDSDGRPLPAVQVTAWEAGHSFFRRPALGETTSDGQGRFRIENLPAGAVNLGAWLSGYYDDRRQNVKAGVSHLRLTLAPMSAPTAPILPLAVGAHAPEIQVARWVNGPGVPSLATLRGKMVLLQFSSAYNSAAKASNAALAALSARLKAASRDDIVILALYDSSSSAADVEAYARAERLPFPIGLLEPGQGEALDNPTFQAYGVRHLPTLFLIDPNGLIRAVDPDQEELLKVAAAVK
jgi:protocatechuate 3,4-dioxygenase beta subunit